MQEREQWRSGLGFALAAAGSAVGLGNLWGFAYRSSQGGGLAFLILYVVVVLVVCLPVLVAEMVLGSFGVLLIGHHKGGDLLSLSFMCWLF